MPPAAWNNNLDTINGALATLNDENATPEELQAAAATLNGLADAFDGSGFERGWDHDNDEATPDQPITAAAQLRKWAGYAKGRAASIYTGVDITAENAPAAWNNNLDAINGALATLSDENATPEELQAAAATLNGLADAFDGSGLSAAGTTTTTRPPLTSRSRPPHSSGSGPAMPATGPPASTPMAATSRRRTPPPRGTATWIPSRERWTPSTTPTPPRRNSGKRPKP